MIRRVSREGVVLLGGGHAVLLQLAHPFVAAGVDEYSNFQSEILHRLYRTGLFMHTLIFLNRQEALKSIKQFHAIHQRIRGRLRHRAGQFPAGTPYSGVDPQTKLWVHATFVDTGLKVYEKFIKPLNPAERRRYYSDTLILAHLLDIPEEIVPQTMEEFQEYMNEMLDSNLLAVTETTQRLAREVLYPKVSFLPSVSAGLLRLVTAGLLTDRFRREYNLKWSRANEFLLNGFCDTTRFLRPLVHPWLWQTPYQDGKFTHYMLWKGLQSINKKNESSENKIKNYTGTYN